MRRRPVGVLLAWMATHPEYPNSWCPYLCRPSGESRIGDRYLKRARVVRDHYTQWMQWLRARAASRLVTGQSTGNAPPAPRPNHSLVYLRCRAIAPNCYRTMQVCSARSSMISSTVQAPVTWNSISGTNGGLADELLTGHGARSRSRRHLPCVLLDAVGSKPFLRKR